MWQMYIVLSEDAMKYGEKAMDKTMDYYGKRKCAGEFTGLVKNTGTLSCGSNEWRSL